MTISYNIVPQVKWYLVDLTGKPAGGGYIAFYDSLDPTQVKAIFQDPAGSLAWPIVPIPNTGLYGVLFDENGTQGPFFWAFDSSNPADAYFLTAFDTDGQQLWQVNNWGPGLAGGGGGSIITEALDLENLVVNNAFYHNAALYNSSTSNVITTGTLITLSPGGHAGLVSNGLTPSDTVVNGAPDLCFIKSGTLSTDALQFKQFLPGDNLLTDDVNPVWYLNYACTVAGGEVKKAIQVPISSGVQYLSNQSVTVKVWVRGNSGNTNITLQWVQFFGDGPSASAPVFTNINAPFTAVPTWQPIIFNFTVPNIAGKTIGECGNDGNFLQINYPLSATCNIDITKPAVYLGNVVPQQDFHTNDMAEAVVNDARTGDVRMSLNTFAPFGWLKMDDGTIGNYGTGATTRASQDTFPLYATIWNNVIDTYAPVSTGRGLTAIADFSAGKTIALTKALGRVLAGVGTPGMNATTIPNGSQTGTVWAIGQTTGYECHLQLEGELAEHNHPGSTVTFDGDVISAGGAFGVAYQGGGGNPHAPTNLSIAIDGSNTPMNIQNPVTYMNVFIKL